MSRTDWNSNEITQRAEVTMPSLSVGSTDVTVTWPVPFADATYAVQSTVHVSALTVGGVATGLKLNTRTATGCTITVYNTTLVTISAGGTLMACGTGSL